MKVKNLSTKRTYLGESNWASHISLFLLEDMHPYAYNVTRQPIISLSKDCVKSYISATHLSKNMHVCFVQRKNAYINY